MQIKSLEMFLKLIELGSFSKTATALHTVQSNVTTHIKKLEETLGAEIVYRQNPIRPTRAGLQLQHYATQIIHLQNEIFHVFNDQNIVQTSPLLIGSMETTAAARLPEIIQQLKNAAPELPFHLSTAASRELIDRVRNAELDCAFIANMKPIEGLYNVHVWSEQLVLVSSKQITQALTPQILSSKKFIAFKQGCSYRKSIDSLLDFYQLPPTHILEMGSLDAMMSCVSLDLGIALLPISYVQQSFYANQVNIHPIDRGIAEIKTYLIADQQPTWSSNMWTFFNTLHHLKTHPVAQHSFAVERSI